MTKDSYPIMDICCETCFVWIWVIGSPFRAVLAYLTTIRIMDIILFQLPISIYRMDQKNIQKRNLKFDIVMINDNSFGTIHNPLH